MEPSPPSRSRDEQATASADLLERARGGDHLALGALLSRQGRALRRWAHRRLPPWARQLSDTADIVQDALLQTFRNIDRFSDRGRGALQAYLRQAVVNRICDEVRRVGRRPAQDSVAALEHAADQTPSPLQTAMDAEREQKYKAALATLTSQERMLVVGRLELGYTYDQLALITDRVTAEAARLAVRRAVIKLAKSMTGA